ncbi:Rha family transcriptional regulator, partial [Enterococcus dispar]|uniref:Rha family transcriptional regulator n=1 Tax=Enterococcus dispar TaxID=44009 RepID=UPI00200DFEF5
MKMKVLEKTITSMEVAEMVGRRHDQVLRDITKIKEHLTDHKSVVSELFIDSTYEDTSGRELPCYLLTKRGCELYSTRMTGAKGTQFALAYIERFNEMETAIKEQSL